MYLHYTKDTIIINYAYCVLPAFNLGKLFHNYVCDDHVFVILCTRDVKFEVVNTT